MSVNTTRDCYNYSIPPTFRYPTKFPEIDMINMAYIFPAQFLIGFTGNLLFLVVLMKPKMRSKTNMIVASMATADLGFFLVSMPVKLRIYPGFKDSYYFYTFWVHYQVYVSIGCQNWFSAISIWLTVAISLERLIAVLYPLHVRDYLRMRYVVIVIITIVVTSFFLILHWFICRTVVTHRICESIKSEHEVFYLFAPIRYKSYFESLNVIGVIVIVLVPFCAIIMLNGYLLKIIVTRTKMREALGARKASERKTSTSSDELKVTRLVLSMILCFILSNFPSAVTYCISLTCKSCQQKYRHAYYIFFQISNILVTNGKMMNFIVFCVGSERFRRELKLLLLACLGRGDKDPRRLSGFSSSYATNNTQMNTLLNGATKGANSHSIRLLNGGQKRRMTTSALNREGRKYPTYSIDMTNMASNPTNGEHTMLNNKRSNSVK